MLKKRIKWFGIDCGSADHSMNTSIRMMRPDIAKRFEQRVGATCEEFFGDYTYVHKKSGRRVTENIFPFHSYAFQEGLIHAENVGGDIEKVLNQRFLIGAFPWRYEGRKRAPAASSASRIAVNWWRRWATSPRPSCRAGRDRDPRLSFVSPLWGSELIHVNRHAGAGRASRTDCITVRPKPRSQLRLQRAHEI